mmetsp:Transcript_13757/g.57829  ORF Transcript_13757/g.57829 Transcript_13757/m.57829 type:complete len:254 (+) Transcript_13757:1248-2009(+)
MAVSNVLNETVPRFFPGSSPAAMASAAKSEKEISFSSNEACSKMCASAMRTWSASSVGKRRQTMSFNSDASNCPSLSLSNASKMARVGICSSSRLERMRSNTSCMPPVNFAGGTALCVFSSYFSECGAEPSALARNRAALCARCEPRMAARKSARVTRTSSMATPSPPGSVITSKCRISRADASGAASCTSRRSWSTLRSDESSLVLSASAKGSAFVDSMTSPELGSGGTISKNACFSVFTPVSSSKYLRSVS